jgi:hydrogenase maturation protein HypF
MPLARASFRPASAGTLGNFVPPDSAAHTGVDRRPVTLATPMPAPALAVGGQTKVRLALAIGQQVMVSNETCGDLGSPAGMARFEAAATNLQAAHGVQAARIICDADPGCSTAQWAGAQTGVVVDRIFHHHAHASALAGEFPAEPRWLCFTWDAGFYGADGTQWGGEALLGAPGAWARRATFRPFAPPGGARAARKEPWRSAAALAWALDLPFAPPLPGPDIALARAAWEQCVNAPATSAVGRLFDAAASLLDLTHYEVHPAQGPIVLEELAALRGGAQPAIHLPLHRCADGLFQADWAPLVAMLYDATHSLAARAACFHASLAASLVSQALAIRAANGEDFAVGLCGDVFQNRVLCRLALAGLADAGLRGFTPVRHPCHDGALSFGQLVEAAALVG